MTAAPAVTITGHGRGASYVLWRPRPCPPAVNVPVYGPRSMVRLKMGDPVHREHGLSEAELLEAYSHLAPVDGGEVGCG